MSNDDKQADQLVEQKDATDTVVETASSDEDLLSQQAQNDSAGQQALEAEEEQGDSASIDGEGTPIESANIEFEKETNDEVVAVSDLPVDHQDDTEEGAELSEEAAEAVVEADSEEVAPVEVDLDEDDNPDAKWYVVHTYSGHENKVATNLKQKIASEHLEAFILDVLVPTQDKIEIRSGKKESVKEKIFPGYILVKMVLTDNSWLAVRTTPGVTSFVGMGNKPTPIPASEVKSIVKFMTQGAISPTFKEVFSVDDPVKIIDGPFAQFIGKVESVDKEHGKVKVLVSIFGRETPVELDFLQVQKL